MARVATGAVTVVDIQDGIHPISAVLSNHNHTFAADSAGTVPESERIAFSCEVYAYVGATRCLYNSVGGVNTYRVSKVDSDQWASSIASVNGGQAIITVTTIPTGTVNKTGTVTLTVTIVNSLGNETVIDMVISLSKAIEGTAGQIVTLTPTRQTFRFDSAGDTADGSIIVSVASVGNTGALSAQYSRNGGAWTALTVGAGANQASSIDIDGLGDNDAIVFTAANFGTSDNFAIRVAGATGGSDTINIVKIQDGSAGAGALLVVISSNSSGFVFKNNAGATKTLSVFVYDMATGGTVIPSAYQWKKNGANLATTATINVTASDITDNGSELYSCEVTVA